MNIFHNIANETISCSMNDIQLHRLDLNLLVTFEVLMDTRSVTGAAERLGKTPSAISHALGRLREQLGDPLMVNVGGAMQPSPFATQLIDEVRPVLRTIRRIVQPPLPFVPAESHRVFRISVPAITALISKVAERVNEEAPDVGLEWVTPGAKTYAHVVEEQIDIAWYGADFPLPDGLSERVMPPIKRYVFTREGHPALANWTKDAWIGWPHVVVGMAQGARQTVEKRLAQLGVERRVGATIPEFSGIAPLVARTNFLCNQVPVMLGDDIDRYNLQVLEPPIEMLDFETRFFWNSRLSNESGNRWIREVVIECFEALRNEANASVAARNLIVPNST